MSSLVEIEFWKRFKTYVIVSDSSRVFDAATL